MRFYAQIFCGRLTCPLADCIAVGATLGGWQAESCTRGPRPIAYPEISAFPAAAGIALSESALLRV